MCKGMQGLHHSMSRKGQLRNWHLTGSIQSAQHSRPSRTCLRGIAACKRIALSVPEQHYRCCVCSTLIHNLPYQKPAACKATCLTSYAKHTCPCTTSLQQAHGSDSSPQLQKQFLACFTALRHLETLFPCWCRMHQHVLGGRLWYKGCQDANQDLPDQLPLNYDSPDHYVSTFEPLLFEEAREAVRSTWLESCDMKKTFTVDITGCGTHAHTYTTWNACQHRCLSQGV